MRKHILVVMTAILVLVLTTVAMAADPHQGTWKLNLAKSKFNPGPAPKSLTVTIQAQDSGVKYVLDGAEADGKAIHQEWAAKYDGKDYPFIGESSRDTMACKKADANTFDWVGKKGGKEVSKIREVISMDGKTLTVTEQGKNEKAEGFKNIFTMEKQ
jgi:hypothetical protein